MHRFASNAYMDVNNARNRIPLCYDLHQKLDDRVFSFVPKGGRYVIHTLSDMASIADEALPEFVSAYHNLPVQRPRPIPREYLFARFALNIIVFAKSFFTCCVVSRKVLRHRIDDNGELDLRGPVDMNPAELMAAFGSGGGKSASPMKRSRSTRGGDAAGDSEDDEFEDALPWEQKRVEDEARGRMSIN
ncbi:hypothetical protein F5B18DRAFT_648074 [Nemania serpens]|nr:hypothetical protein F5B18DRAFT_648074 [Nemania serpens]